MFMQGTIWEDIHCIEYQEMNWYMNNVGAYLDCIESNRNKKLMVLAINHYKNLCSECTNEEWQLKARIGIRMDVAPLALDLPFTDCPDE